MTMSSQTLSGMLPQREAKYDYILRFVNMSNVSVATIYKYKGSKVRHSDEI